MADARETLLAALTTLTRHWSSAEYQQRVAHGVAVDLDDTAVRAISYLGFVGEARPGAIAHEMHITRPTASKLLARLEEASFIERTPDAHDARARNVRLTPEGRAAFARLVEGGIRLVHSATEQWADADLERFASLLDAFVGELVSERTLLRAVGPAGDDRAAVSPPGKEEK